MDRLISKYGDAATLYLPVGRSADGGSCDFATETCLRECFERADSGPLHRERLTYVRQNCSGVLAGRIMEEMDALDRDHFFWLASGDVQADQTDKICAVATALSDNGFHQNGFTRNKRFWRHVNALPQAVLALSIDERAKALQRSTEGLVALPDYATQRTWLLTNHHPLYFCGGGFGGGGSCGFSFMEENGEIFEADCRDCRLADRGCWVGAPSSVERNTEGDVAQKTCTKKHPWLPKYGDHPVTKNTELYDSYGRRNF